MLFPGLPQFFMLGHLLLPTFFELNSCIAVDIFCMRAVVLLFGDESVCQVLSSSVLEMDLLCALSRMS